jgi:hypothetical protein
MVEILVTEIRARRLSAAGDCFWAVDMTSRCVSPRPRVPLFPLLRALFFPLFSIVIAPADFLKLAQSLTL